MYATNILPYYLITLFRTYPGKRFYLPDVKNFIKSCNNHTFTRNAVERFTL